MEVYVVTMYRWGSRENHSYVRGVFSSEEKAMEAGMDEAVYRGGKYGPSVIKVVVDSDDCAEE
jgi:hypothetical protein